MLPHIFAKMPTPCTAIKHRIKISEAQKSIWKTLKKLLKEAKKKNHQHTQIMRGNTIIALPRYKEIVERKEMVLTSMMRHWFSSFFKRLGRGGSLNASCWRHLKFCHVRKYLKNRMLMQGTISSITIYLRFIICIITMPLNSCSLCQSFLFFL